MNAVLRHAGQAMHEANDHRCTHGIAGVLTVTLYLHLCERPCKALGMVHKHMLDPPGKW